MASKPKPLSAAEYAEAMMAFKKSGFKVTTASRAYSKSAKAAQKLMRAAVDFALCVADEIVVLPNKGKKR